MTAAEATALARDLTLLPVECCGPVLAPSDLANAILPGRRRSLGNVRTPKRIGRVEAAALARNLTALRFESSVPALAPSYAGDGISPERRRLLALRLRRRTPENAK